MSKWGAGKLHSGGPGGPVVKNQKQAEAIMESEKRKSEGSGAKAEEYKPHPAAKAFGR
jgi:hypothetical protein